MQTQFSVFLPVRNGGDYVKECVRSILAQTYPEFELQVLDNDSTDGTSTWLRTIKDPRVRIWPSERSLSIQENWNRIRQCQKREFMTTIGHDDTFDPHFLETVRDLVVKHPDASLYQTGARFINAEGKTIRKCRPVPEHETAAQYLKARLTYERDVFGTGYVMRSVDYDRVGGIPGFERLFFADDGLFLSLMRGSSKAASNLEAVAVRIHPASESASTPASWPSLLLGLEQFMDFLQRYIKEEPESASVFGTYGPGFLMRYHRNIYIYALVAACEQGKTIDNLTLNRIKAPLDRHAPEASRQFRDSTVIRVLEAFNSMRLRTIVPGAWKLYTLARTKSFSLRK